MRIGICGFNPLPSQKQGETPRPRPRGRVNPVSIRSPHKSKGRPTLREDRRRDSTVSIRSPHKSKGRPPSAANAAFLWVFQSAPLTKARGDVVLVLSTVGAACFNPLPSQKQGETSTWIRSDRGRVVSIRSPHKSKGRPEAQAPDFKALKFQSAPLTKARGDIQI